MPTYMPMRAFATVCLLLASNVSDAAAAPLAIAVGSQYTPRISDESATCSPTMLQYDGAHWKKTLLPVTARCNLLGATFSDASTAWAYGTRGAGGGGILLRSADHGESWSDATQSLPQSLQAGFSRTLELVAVGFETSQSGWIIAKTTFNGGIALAHTIDGGSHWGDPIALPGGPPAGNYRFLTGVMDSLFWGVGDSRSVFDSVDLAPAQRRELANSAGLEIHDAMRIGSRYILCGSIASSSGTRNPALVSWNRGDESTMAGITRPPLAEGAATAIAASPNLAVVCGSVSDMNVPFCLRSRDAGISWDAGKLTSLPGPAVLQHAIVIDDSAAFVVSYSLTDPESQLVQTNDGGLTWSPLPAGTTQDIIIHGLVASPTPQRGS